MLPDLITEETIAHLCARIRESSELAQTLLADPSLCLSVEQKTMLYKIFFAQTWTEQLLGGQIPDPTTPGVELRLKLNEIQVSIP